MFPPPLLSVLLPFLLPELVPVVGKTKTYSHALTREASLLELNLKQQGQQKKTIMTNVAQQ